MQTADTLKKVCQQLGIKLIFKSSYDKANRTSMSGRGIGMEQGLRILDEVKKQLELPILTDVHAPPSTPCIRPSRPWRSSMTSSGTSPTAQRNRSRRAIHASAGTDARWPPPHSAGGVRAATSSCGTP